MTETERNNRLFPTQSTPDRPFLTVNELTAYLNCSISMAYRLIHSEGFPSIRIRGKILVPVDKLKEWIEKQSEGGSRG